MNHIRKEIRELITINEKIQSALMQGECMTADEMEIIKMCASELLTNISNKLRDDIQCRLEERHRIVSS